ncbi:hypothetical protein [Virgibacillus necropolis]|uniref:hypothetical protein n=1 Tax=Virgibacillus necropolis TaxID=163877 RepID=UPI00126A51B5|nr:hypothetical protein [Virgibacillus necropolis]
MENRVFVVLREWYELHNEILTAGKLQGRMDGNCSAGYVLEGIYVFNSYLDERRRSSRKMNF